MFQAAKSVRPAVESTEIQPPNSKLASEQTMSGIFGIAPEAIDPRAISGAVCIFQPNQSGIPIAIKPFQLLLATAFSENMPIISADENFVLYQPQIQLIANR